MTITRAGLRSTLQDNGRKNSQHQGLAQGGAGDLHSFRWANKLLDNDISAACIEVLLGQFAMTANTSATIAVSGADTALTINDRPARLWQTHTLNAGDKIELGATRQGMLNYIAVKDGWLTESFCGSRAAVIREKLPGLSALDNGNSLPCSPAKSPLRRVPEQHRPDYCAPLTLRFIPGYQYENFSMASRRRFIQQHYRVSNQIDRMAYLLEGEPLKPPEESLLSEGIAMGSIQIPGNGYPVILLNDRQTMGGYQKLGCVAALDCSRLCQRGPGTSLRFQAVDLADIQNERMLFEAFFEKTRWMDGESLRWT